MRGQITVHFQSKTFYKTMWGGKKERELNFIRSMPSYIKKIRHLPPSLSPSLTHSLPPSPLL